MDDALERLVAALVRAPAAWRGILNDWNDLDDELREHYAEDAEALLLSVKSRFLERYSDIRAWRLFSSIAGAIRDLSVFGDSIEQTMGFRPEIVLPHDFAAIHAMQPLSSSPLLLARQTDVLPHGAVDSLDVRGVEVDQLDLKSIRPLSQ